ncbi:hypothetical protein GE21DRAFT_1286309 [Neurospora crassa]|nr:hypothetical protein GE21DRAFT_1286309 [Neurospora crassa]
MPGRSEGKGLACLFMCLCVLMSCFPVTFCLRVPASGIASTMRSPLRDPLGRALIQLRFTVCDKFGRGSPRGTELRVNGCGWRRLCAHQNIGIR